jgi:drug/metabolite transporter (DMT)-like permease
MGRALGGLGRMNYKLGSLYGTIAAFLLATQEPFSFLAAERLSTLQFVFLTQVSLLVSLPFLLARPKSRRAFAALFAEASNYLYFAAILAMGIAGLLLYNLGLSQTHPVIVSVILNLSPFWAALVALVVTRVPIPVSPAVFSACFIGAFLGAMAVTLSQLGGANAAMGEVGQSLMKGGWLYIVPVPLLFALSATLIGKWFAGRDESATIAANFLVANVALIPTTLFLLYQRSELNLDHWRAIELMIAGTIMAGSFARVLYQVAMTVTGNDNGFVTMFFNLVPALTALISFLMSRWISDLHVVLDPLFFAGLALICASLVIFSLKSWRQPARTGVTGTAATARA